MGDLLFYIVCGTGVGLAIGLTGVGGGSLMTPLLILYGVPTKIAIGTDLLYASATKLGALVSHQREQNVNWRTVALLASGSIPASIATSAAFRLAAGDGVDYTQGLNTALGVMLILTAAVVLFRSRIKQEAETEAQQNRWYLRHTSVITVIAGIALGVLVTLSSVGAGAFCAALLLTLFPRVPALKIVGTDVAHAVPLTMVAGLGHLWNNNVNWSLLAGLLIGSLPAVHFAAKAAKHIPNSVLQKILATMLFFIGAKFAFASI